jgi:hypothetical protein
MVVGAEEVLRIKRGVVRAAPRGDDHEARAVGADGRGNGLRARAPLVEQPGQGLGLLADLRVQNAAHAADLNLMKLQL